MDAFLPIASFTVVLAATGLAHAQSNAERQALMADIAHEMEHMQQELREGETIPVARKHMAAEMRQLSEALRRMAAWAEEPDGRAREEYLDLRRKVDEMARSHSGAWTAASN